MITNAAITAMVRQGLSDAEHAAVLEIIETAGDAYEGSEIAEVIQDARSDPANN